MTRIASRAPDLDILGQRLIDREVGYWIITAEGLKVVDTLEQLDRIVAGNMMIAISGAMIRRDTQASVRRCFGE
jgi:hypothetical protein